MKNIYNKTKLGRELKEKFEQEILKEDSIDMDFLSALFHFLFVLQLLATLTATSILGAWIFGLPLGIDLENPFAKFIPVAHFFFSVFFIFATRFYTHKKRVIVREWRKFKSSMRKLGLDKVIVYSEFLCQYSEKVFFDTFSIFGFLSKKEDRCHPRKSLTFANHGRFVFRKLQKMKYEFPETGLWPALTM